MKIQNPHDKFFKETMGNLETAKDFLTNYLPESMAEKWMEEGMEKGMKKGILKGREEGMERGMEEAERLLYPKQRFNF